ncbi:hypothetical protein KFE18_11635 [Clostridiaceae bacterium Marseille-Q4143]|nr:hypothetical protein KFE18_11635 [Clostridiaceae bacterium Marseille-Q4143]
MNMKKRLLILSLSLCLGLGGSLTAYAEEANPPAAESTENAETAVQTESAPAAEAASAAENAESTPAAENTQTEAAPATQAATDDTAKAANTTTTDDGKKDGNSNTVTTEKPNTDIKVTPSNANALILMDAGAQSPKAAPGQTVEVVLPLAVNREYLPSEKYLLRNITIRLDIPKDSTKDTWPFNVVDASSTKHLDDMSYNSTAEVWYKLTVSEFAKEGVYPVNFTVNATVWREDSVNGTDVQEDVTFSMNVFMTVVGNGNMSGVTSAISPLEIAGREDHAIASPTGKPGETVVMSIPIVNKGQTLTNVTVAPVVTGDLETFPFVTTDINYGRELGTMENGTRQTVDWPMTISPYATTGNKVVTFRATYEENGVYGECTFNAYVYVKDGWVQESAPSLMVESYGLYVDDEEVQTVEAGKDVVLKLKLKNNAAKDIIYKTVATLKLADANSLILTSGYSDAAYVRSISAGQTTDIEYHITARASASVGPSAATITLAYENQDVVQGSATSTIQIPIKQPMNLQLDTPVVYGTPVQGEPVAVSLNMVNLGRSRAYNVSIVAMNGISMQDAYFGGDILAAGNLNADIQIIPNKSGQYAGTLVVQYEDADGEQYTQNVNVDLDTAPAVDETAVQADSENVEVQKKGGLPWWLVTFLILLIIICALLAWYFLVYKKKQEAQAEGAPEEKAQADKDQDEIQIINLEDEDNE